MKKLTLIFSLLVILLITIFYSCQKEIVSTDTKFTVSEAKEWYYGSYRKSEEYKNAFNATGIKRYPDWKHGIEQRKGNYQIVEFPLNSSKRFADVSKNASYSNAEKQRIINSTLDRVLFIKGPNGIINVRFVTYIPDLNYLKNHNYDISNNTITKIDNDFSGFVMIKQWDGKLLKGFKLANGKITRKLTGNEIRHLENNKHSSVSRTSENCSWTYNDVYEISFAGHMEGDQIVWDYIIIDYLGTDDWEFQGCTDLDPQFPDFDPCDWGLCGGSGGGGSGQIIIPDASITEHAEVNCVYQKLMTASLQFGLKNILASFDNSQVYNVTFKVEDIDSDGKTRYLGNNNFLIRIDETNAYDTDYSRIWLASTFIHEAFHAKLRQKAFELLGTDIIQNWPKDIDDMTLSELATYFQQSAELENVWQSVGHDWMVNHVDEMANSIKEFVQTFYPAVYNGVTANNGDPSAYKALALMGLSGSQFYSEVASTLGTTDQINELRRLLAINGASNCPQ